MQTTLLKIRLIQLRRLAAGLGWFYSLFFLVLLAGALLVVHRQFQSQSGALVVLAGIAGIVFLVHQSRADKPFAFKHFPDPRGQFFTEYLLFTFPFSVPAYFSPNWYLTLLLVPALGLIAGIKGELRHKTRLPQLGGLIGTRNFEWISGIRQAFPFLAVLLVLALATSWLKFVPLLFLWLFTVTAVAFYQQCESRVMLQATGKTARKFLFGKLIQHGTLLLGLTLPALVLNSLFNWEWAWVNGVFILLQITLLSFAIFQKYSTFSPNANLTGNSLLLSIAAIGVLIPFLLPLPLLLSVRNYGKAVRNLNYYLHDQPA